jgi:hypothetical protein
VLGCLPQIDFRASNFVASFELSMWAVANGCGWTQMVRAVEAKEAATAAVAELFAVELAAVTAAAAEQAAAEAAAAELSACVEAAFHLFNDLDVDAAGVWGGGVVIPLIDQFAGDTMYQAICNLVSDGHIYYAAITARRGLPSIPRVRVTDGWFKCNYGEEDDDIGGGSPSESETDSESGDPPTMDPVITRKND